MHHGEPAVERHVGGNIDDTPLFPFLHGRHDGAAAQPQSFDIDGHNSIPSFFGDFLPAALFRRHAQENCRIVHQSVDLAKSLQALFRHRLATREARNIYVTSERLPAIVLDRLGGIVGRLFIDVRSDRNSPFARYAPTISFPDPVPATGHDHNLAVEKPHDITPHEWCPYAAADYFLERRITLRS